MAGRNRQEEPYIKILVQPASKALRFRYECEGRSAGSIPGVTSTPENKTYPTIQIHGYRGRAVVVVSCVTKADDPYRPHPHNLVGREGCKKGVCTVEVNSESMTQSFDHLGIQCVKKKDIEEALKVRQEIRVDPFMTGFQHKSQPGNIDLNAVRLCFQAFLETEPGKFKRPLKPVVSEIIYDKKALCDLAICQLSHSSAPVNGGHQMILLCEKVAKEDIKVRFYEEQNGEIVWEAFGDFTPSHVHKQVAITFKTPKYKTLQVDGPVGVFIQLYRPTDHECSQPHPFQLTPMDSGVSGELTRKKPKFSHQASEMSQDRDPLRTTMVNHNRSPGCVKREPVETSPNPYLRSEYSPGPSGLQYSQSPSPHHHPPGVYPPGVYTPLVYPPDYVYVTHTQLSPQVPDMLDPHVTQVPMDRRSPQVEVSPRTFYPMENAISIGEGPVNGNGGFPDANPPTANNNEELINIHHIDEDLDVNLSGLSLHNDSINRMSEITTESLTNIINNLQY